MDEQTLRTDEGGFSLVELLVTMLVLGVVMAALTTSIVSIQRTSYRIDVRTENVASVRLALANSSQVLRAATAAEPGAEGAPAFEVVERRRVVFTTLIDDLNRPSRVELELTAQGQLHQRVWAPAVTGGTVTYPNIPRERVLARDLDAGASGFTFYVRAESGADSVLSTDGGPPGADVRRRISRVGIDLLLSRDRSGQVGGQTLSTEVRLPNQGVT